MRLSLILLGILLSHAGFASTRARDLGIEVEGKLLTLCAVKEDHVLHGQKFSDAKGFALLENKRENLLYICQTFEKVYFSEVNQQIELGPYSFKYVEFIPETPYWVCSYLPLEKNKIVKQENAMSSEIVVEKVFTLKAARDNSEASSISFESKFPLRDYTFLKNKNIHKYKCE